MGGGGTEGANFSFGLRLVRNQLLNGLKNRPELLIIPLLHIGNLSSQLPVRIHQPPELHKRPHDGYAHFYRSIRS